MCFQSLETSWHHSLNSWIPLRRVGDVSRKGWRTYKPLFFHYTTIQTLPPSPFTDQKEICDVFCYISKYIIWCFNQAIFYCIFLLFLDELRSWIQSCLTKEWMDEDGDWNADESFILCSGIVKYIKKRWVLVKRNWNKNPQRESSENLGRTEVFPRRESWPRETPHLGRLRKHLRKMRSNQRKRENAASGVKDVWYSYFMLTASPTSLNNRTSCMFCLRRTLTFSMLLHQIKSLFT